MNPNNVSITPVRAAIEDTLVVGAITFVTSLIGLGDTVITNQVLWITFLPACLVGLVTWARCRGIHMEKE